MRQITVQGLFVLGYFIVALIGCSCSDNQEKTDRIWYSQGHSPSEYANAAMTILVEMDTRDKPVTLGAVVSTLGVPSSISTVGYTFDEKGNVIANLTRLLIHYESRGVSVSFAVSGSVETVLRDTTSGERKGKSLLSWPRIINDKNLPLTSGPFRGPHDVSRLLEAAAGLAKDGTKEAYWYKRIIGLPRDEGKESDLSDYENPCQVQVAVVDAITPDLARVTYNVHGEHMLYWDMWWVQQRKIIWRPITEEQAMEILSKIEGK